MPIFIFLLGVRGAGKTTLIDNVVTSISHIKRLLPTTNRPRRFNEEKEYHFVDDIVCDDDFLWVVSVGDYKYGVSKNEIDGLSENDICICPFDTFSYDKLTDFRKKNPGRVVTIGLDTVDSLSEQHERVNHDRNRCMDEKGFNKAVDIVRSADTVLEGDCEILLSSMLAVLNCIKNNGGVLIRRQIEPLLKSNCLLRNSIQRSSIASYDLRLGDDVWCQGEYIKLDERRPTLKIPPYSYAIVSCLEKANLPSFVSARFDLKNSLFFNGIILSNGPQVDPGYRGALFCMLYNGSDLPFGITRSKEFSTIEFHTTAGLSDGYDGKYQDKLMLSDFIPAAAAVSAGGKILERTQEEIGNIRSEWSKHKSGIWAAYGIAVAIFGIVVAIGSVYFQYSLGQLSESESSLEERHKDFDRRLEKLVRLELQVEQGFQELNSQSSSESYVGDNAVNTEDGDEINND